MQKSIIGKPENRPKSHWFYDVNYVHAMYFYDIRFCKDHKSNTCKEPHVTCDKDRRLARPTYVDLRPPQLPQRLEAPPRTSTAHLAADPGSRPSAAQPRTELSVATRPKWRMMEATCGNGYAPVRGLLAIVMMTRNLSKEIGQTKHEPIPITQQTLKNAKKLTISSCSKNAK